LNESLFDMINRLAGHYDWLDDLMEIFAQDIVWLMIGVLAVLWFTGKEDNQKAVFHACLTAAAALMIASLLISPLVDHPRPFVTHEVTQLIPHAADPSFPSDHSTLAFSLAFSLMFVKRRAGLMMLVLAILTGISRIFVGVHYPGDILGAIILSFVTSLLVLVLRNKIDPLPSFIIRVYRRMIQVLPFGRQ